jgi:hypothetical protein
VFLAPFEELHKKYGVGPNSRFFSKIFGSEVSGARRVQQEVRGME